ncbi:hypothetical protein PG997_004615 [Apiospora hydei]|uniref:BZIP domain-containing protein n=1 Tax=Apiospora hydei TaxID=1337664 RepID=A0ABR1X2P3_9PEZI
MSIPTFEVEDPELENQQRLERRRELNRKAQRRFRTRRNQARIRQIEQDNHLATGWSNDWPWSNSPPTVPLVAQNQTAGHTSVEVDEPLALDISALDSMLYPTIPQGVPLIEPPALSPFQSPATTVAATDSQPLASHAAAFISQDGEHHTAAAQQIYPSWGAADLSGMTLAESPQETIVTNTGSPYMPENSVWPGMMDMSPSQSPEMLLPACFFPPTMAFDPTTIPVATTETTSPMDSQEALNWADMENMQAAFLWSPVPGTYV